MLLLGFVLSLLCLTRQVAALSSDGMLLQPGDQEHRMELLPEPSSQREQQYGLMADGQGLQSFPSVTNSTILFLHVFKVGGLHLHTARSSRCV